MYDEIENKKDVNFIVKIKYQQNQAVQGLVIWVDTGKTINFRSYMELFHLMVEACDNLDFRSWEVK
jgi:transcriptional regulatory protein LevR